MFSHDMCFQCKSYGIDPSEDPCRNCVNDFGDEPSQFEWVGDVREKTTNIIQNVCDDIKSLDMEFKEGKIGEIAYRRLALILTTRLILLLNTLW